MDFHFVLRLELFSCNIMWCKIWKLNILHTCIYALNLNKVCYDFYIFIFLQDNTYSKITNVRMSKSETIFINEKYNYIIYQATQWWTDISLIFHNLKNVIKSQKLILLLTNFFLSLLHFSNVKIEIMAQPLYAVQRPMFQVCSVRFSLKLFSNFWRD